jgi:heptaprenyl diphosphate synthase
VAKLGIPFLASRLERELKSGIDDVENLIRRQIEGKYPLVIETSRHLVEAGGKRVRPLLTLLASQFGDPKAKGIIEAAAVCELTHLATLYHDDVMDEATLRRGVPSANSRWDNTVAILTGDYLFAKVSDLLADLGPDAVRIHAHTFERLVIGQIMETQGAMSSSDPITHYLDVIADKTGSLMATAAQYGAMFAGAEEKHTQALKDFGEAVGLLFQIADDVIDISSDSNESGKVPGTDLREGVPTMVTLHILLSKNPSDAELKERLSSPITDERVVQKTIQELRDHWALAKTKEQLIQLADTAVEKIAPLPSGEAKDALISLSKAVISRTS